MSIIKYITKKKKNRNTVLKYKAFALYYLIEINKFYQNWPDIFYILQKSE